MFVQRLSLATLSILACVLLAGNSGGQQPPSPNEAQQIAALSHRVDALNLVLQADSQRIDSLSGRADDLQKSLDNIAEATATSGGDGRYQISVASVPTVGGLTFAEVFRVDTQTGLVCQVVSTKVVRGEEVGSTLPIC